MRQRKRVPLRVAPPDQRISPAPGRSPRRRNGAGFPAATRWPEIRETPSSAPSSGHLLSEHQKITPVELHDHELVLTEQLLDRVPERQLLRDPPEQAHDLPKPLTDISTHHSDVVNNCSRTRSRITGPPRQSPSAPTILACPSEPPTRSRLSQPRSLS